MKVTLKYYKFLKIKKQLKKNEILLFYYLDDSHSKAWFTVEKLLKKLNLDHYKLQNRIAKSSFNRSIYKSFKNLINGPMIFVTFKVLTDLLFFVFFKVNKILTFIGIKLNTVFYLRNQINVIRVLGYKKTIVEFYSILKKRIKFIKKIFFIRNNVI